MTKIRLLAASAVMMLAVGPLFARSDPPPANNVDREKWEDVEVFRRLLQKKLSRDSQDAGWISSTQGQGINVLNPANSLEAGSAYPLYGMASSATVEGAVIGEIGVVFLVTMSPMAADPRATVASPTTEKVGDWDQMRKQVRGDATIKSSTNPQSARPSVGDVVVQILSENGHRMRHLKPDDVVSVAVVFRQNRGEARFSGQNPSAPAVATIPVSGSNNRGVFASPTAPRAPEAPPSPARKQMFVGDLHQRQERWDDALAAYQKALTLAAESEAEQIELMTKLAEVRLHLGQLEEAQLVLKALVELKAKNNPVKGDSPKPLAVKHPVKMIFTAKRSLLDLLNSPGVAPGDALKKISIQYVME